MTQTTVLSLAFQISKYSIVYFFGLDKSLDVAFFGTVVIPGPCFDVTYIKLNKSNWSIHISIAITYDATSTRIDEGRVSVYTFHTFNRNVFSSFEFDKIFLPVYDTKA